MPSSTALVDGWPTSTTTGADAPRRAGPATSPSCCRPAHRCRRSKRRCASAKSPTVPRTARVVYADRRDPPSHAGAPGGRRPDRSNSPLVAALRTPAVRLQRRRAVRVGARRRPRGTCGQATAGRAADHPVADAIAHLRSRRANGSVADACRPARGARRRATASSMPRSTALTPRRVAAGPLRDRPGQRMERRRRPRCCVATCVGAPAVAGGPQSPTAILPETRQRRGADHDDPRGQGPRVPDHDRVRARHQPQRTLDVTASLAERRLDAGGSQTPTRCTRLQAARRADERRRAATAAVRRLHPGRWTIWSCPSTAAATRPARPGKSRAPVLAAGAAAEPGSASATRHRPRCPSPSPVRRDRAAVGRRRGVGRPNARRPRPRQASAARITSPASPTTSQDDGRRRPGLRKDAVDLDLPPWQSGRYGTAVGRAVHGVLQYADLAPDGHRATPRRRRGRGHPRDGRDGRRARPLGDRGADRGRGTGHEHHREMFVAARRRPPVEGYIDLFVGHRWWSSSTTRPTVDRHGDVRGTHRPGTAANSRPTGSPSKRCSANRWPPAC